MFDKNKFKYYVAVRNKTLGDVAEYLGVSNSTLTRKINGESDFYRAEIQGVAALLSLSQEQVSEIFFK
uniref:Regulatory protein n=1 Tax=Siphoviridae sp. ct3q24 TaxID=2827772 RepID=A0A8S5SFC7_9CAUD|nr:MAG TPA: Regulatory protein [Siphoviridae sp. ct3q24]DAL94852.1 MAG TPA: Regulatory protein [Caudoviricetes sp.]